MSRTGFHEHANNDAEEAADFGHARAILRFWSRAIAGNALRHRWHSRQRRSFGTCKLQNLKEAGKFVGLQDIAPASWNMFALVPDLTRSVELGPGDGRKLRMLIEGTSPPMSAQRIDVSAAAPSRATRPTAQRWRRLQPQRSVARQSRA
jgi:hypothetical protein